jgi:hypothetical protein
VGHDGRNHKPFLFFSSNQFCAATPASLVDVNEEKTQFGDIRNVPSTDVLIECPSAEKHI